MLQGKNVCGESNGKKIPNFLCQPGYNVDMNNPVTEPIAERKCSPRLNPSCARMLLLWGEAWERFNKARSGTDICRGRLTVAGVKNTTDDAPLKCPSGYSYTRNYRGQPDRCGKPGRWIFNAPPLQFNSN